MIKGGESSVLEPPELGHMSRQSFGETSVEQMPFICKAKPHQAIVNFLWAGWGRYQRTGHFHWPKTQLHRLGITRALGESKRHSWTDSDLWSLALTDELTGLLNRRGFDLLAYQQLKLARRNKRNFLVFYCDLDNFKHINDRFGHETGDEALIRTARVLEKTFRKSDVLARFGGDEFVVLALETKEPGEHGIERRLQKNLGEANAVEPLYPLSLSIGAAGPAPGRLDSLRELLSRADQNLYLAKNQSVERPTPAGAWSDVEVVQFVGGGKPEVARRHPVRRQPGSERANEVEG